MSPENTFNVEIEHLILLEEALWERYEIHKMISKKLQGKDHDKALRHAYKADDFEELAQMVTDLINSSQSNVKEALDANISN
jgi:hypothetical protein